MQVWDQVKVIDPESLYAGEAGLVQKSDANGNTVKLDNVEKVQIFTDEQLQFLGR
ncbi:hypothetical protein [Comamonas sp.]|uniref:hypothetical protein n=1 Tax=Comamonas sp. TaxID=34028 RepID=UPI003A8CAAA7